MKIKKIININDVAKIVAKEKSKNKKIVHCHGVFDFFHLGHLKYFKSAKSYGDILIVSLTSDKFVSKGFNRPFYKLSQRAELLSSIDIIDLIVVSDSQNGEKIIEKIKPDFYVKGPDYKNNKKDITGNIYKEINVVKKFGGKIIYTKDETLSSSNLLNDNFNNLNEKQKKHQSFLKKKYSFDQIKNALDKISSIKVNAIGETIIDEYVFSESIGKSGKEPHLVIRDLREEIYPGGIVAIAKHLESFTSNLEIISILGDRKKDLKFIKKFLKKNTKFDFILKSNSPTIRKKRFIDNLTNHKLLGLYSINDRELSFSETKKLNKKLFKKNNKNNLTIVSDYGHGFISPAIAKKICSNFKNVFLNAQLNAANIGFHTLKNYNNFNSLIINESELRHEFKDRYSSVKLLIKKLSKVLKVQNILVTRGANGALCYQVNKEKFFEAPAYASKIIDKVGAGDALLSIFSLCIYSKIPIDLSLFISSFAAATVVESMGNSKAIDKKLLLKNIEYFLK